MTARKGKEERKMMTYPTLEKAQEAYAAAAPGRCKAIAEIEHGDNRPEGQGGNYGKATKRGYREGGGSD